MKNISALLLCIIFSISIFAQSTQSVNIIFSGINNRTSNYQVIVDENVFFSNKNYTLNGNQNVATLNNLVTGKHDIKVYKLKNNNPKYNSASKTTFVYKKLFDLREGYDMDITINTAGRVQFSEISFNSNEQVKDRTPMANYQFNQLLQSVRSKFSQALKGETESEAFGNSNNFFTTSQVKQLITLIGSESDRVDLTKLAYRSITDSANFTQLYDLFKLQASKDELNDFLRSKGWNVNNDPSLSKTAMPEGKFNTLLQSVRSKWSQALKGETESEAFNSQNNYFRTSQIRQLLTLISSENDRLDLAKLSYRSVTDSSNFTQLFDLFKIQSSKDELNDFLRSKGWNVNGGNNSKIPMTDNKFSALLQSVRSKFSQALKGETESEAFNNSSNYFNTLQVRQLLTLITSENDRLDLIKLSYRAVTDTANFTRLYDLFNTQASKDELNNFLRSKGWNIATTDQTTTKTPMPDADFNQLLNNVRGNLIQLLKVNYERDIFINSNNYFTTNQLRQLLLLINSESNRLELAKLSYRTVIDPLNFLQLTKLLESQSSRNELQKYVQEYR